MNYKVQGDTIVTHVTNFLLFQGHLFSLGLKLLINHALCICEATIEKSDGLKPFESPSQWTTKMKLYFRKTEPIS